MRKERGIGSILKNIALLPFSAVVVKAPQKEGLSAYFLERPSGVSRTCIEGEELLIPTGSTVKVKVAGEDILIKDWRERPGHMPGASVEIGENLVLLDEKCDKTMTPSGATVIYKANE